MASFTLFLVLFLAVLCLCSSCDENECMEVVGRLQIPDGSLAVNIPVVLNGGDYKAFSKIDGSFRFERIPSGVYSLDVFSLKDHFPLLKLKVVSENQSVSVIEYKYLGGNRFPASYPIVLSALTPIVYNIPRPPFSILGMIMANPMIIMMLFSLVMVVGFPMMLKGLSPEELEEMKKSGAGDPMKQLTDLMGVKAPQSSNNDDDE